MSRTGILIISDEPEFARAVAASWQTAGQAVEITVATGDVWHSSAAVGYGVVIVGPVRDGQSETIVSALGVSSGTAIVFVVDDERTCAVLQAEHPQLSFIAREGSWTSSLIAASREALRRVEAAGRAQRAERVALENQSYATLARYMLEVRPSINNALTSVLGNADLLLFDPRLAGEDSRRQIRTIHTMALRLNEIMQRFGSLANEIRMNENESQVETEGLAERLVGGP